MVEAKVKGKMKNKKVKQELKMISLEVSINLRKLSHFLPGEKLLNNDQNTRISK